MARALFGRCPATHSTGGVVSFFLYTLLTLLFGAVVVGNWLAGPGWMAPQLEWAVIGMGAALGAYHFFYGRHVLLREYRAGRDPRERAVTWRQAAIITFILVAVAALFTYVIFKRD